MENNNRGNERLPAANIAAGVFEQKEKKKRETKIWIYFGLFWSSWSLSLCQCLF